MSGEPFTAITEAEDEAAERIVQGWTARENENHSTEFFASANIRYRCLRDHDRSTDGRHGCYFMARPYWSRWPAPPAAVKRSLPTHAGVRAMEVQVPS